MTGGTRPGWARHRLKFSATINAQSLSEDTDPDFEFDYVDISRVTQGRVHDDPQPAVFSSAPSRARRLAVPGDTLVSTVRTYLRAVAEVEASETPQVFSTGFAVLRAREAVLHPRFLSYYLQSQAFIDRVVADSVGVSYPAVNVADIAGYDLYAPALRQQNAIADFLDRETAQIDAMIEAQANLISHLAVRRAATITSAVSAGLRGTAARPSGLPWLGDVPKNWSIKPLKEIGRATTGLTYSPEDLVDGDEGTLVLRSGNIQNGNLDFDDCVYVSAPIPPNKRTRRGDLLICARNGSAQLIGKSALINEKAVGETWGAFMSVFRSRENDYLFWVMQSDVFKRQLGLFATTTINQLTNGMLHNMRIALPPADEREEIVTHLVVRVGLLDELISEAKATVSLLHERREALITAAVTGRIDPETGIERIEEAS